MRSTILNGTINCSWDSVIPFDEMWLRLNKLIKPNGAIVLFGSEPFSSALRMSNIKNYKYDWVWVKSLKTGFHSSNYRPLKKHENISLFSTGGVSFISNKRCLYNPLGLIESGKTNKRGRDGTGYRGVSINKYKQNFTNYPSSILNFNSENGHHPTQKPVALMEYLIRTYTNENEIVLDFTMGSGSTLVACKNTNRKGIGIELDEGYFKITKQRLINTGKPLF